MKCEVCGTEDPKAFKGSRMRSKCNTHRNMGLDDIEHMRVKSDQDRINKLWLPRNLQENDSWTGARMEYQPPAQDNQGTKIIL